MPVPDVIYRVENYISSGYPNERWRGSNLNPIRLYSSDDQFAKAIADRTVIIDEQAIVTRYSIANENCSQNVMDLLNEQDAAARFVEIYPRNERGGYLPRPARYTALRTAFKRSITTALHNAFPR